MNVSLAYEATSYESVGRFADADSLNPVSRTLLMNSAYRLICARGQRVSAQSRITIYGARLFSRRQSIDPNDHERAILLIDHHLLHDNSSS